METFHCNHINCASISLLSLVWDKSPCIHPPGTSSIPLLPFLFAIMINLTCHFTWLGSGRRSCHEYVLLILEEEFTVVVLPMVGSSQAFDLRGDSATRRSFEFPHTNVSVSIIIDPVGGVDDPSTNHYPNCFSSIQLLVKKKQNLVLCVL